MSLNRTVNAIRTAVMFMIIIAIFVSLKFISASASLTALPAIKVNLLENKVEAFSWPLNSLLNLTISGSGAPYTAQATAAPDPWGTSGFTFKLGAAFDLQPGQTVTVTDGTTTKVLTVMDLYVDSYDPANKIIAGHSAANAVVRLDIWVQGVPYQEVTADGTGSWQVTYGASYDPFSPFTSGTAASSDEDGDMTQFQINLGRLSARTDWPGADNVFFITCGGSCGAARSYTLTVDDPSNGAGVDYQNTQTSTVAGWGSFVNFIFTGFELDAGDQVTVASGHHIRTLVVTPKGSLSFDAPNDIISGVNLPSHYLTITTPGAERTVKAGSDGKWTIDYSKTGPNGEPTEDIVPGMKGTVAEFDADGDNTTYGWKVPFLQFLPTIGKSGS